jgi:dephospho-CoA kinase
MTTRLIGLTGNIGCGKSTVAKLLAQLPGVAIYDVDLVWKELLTTTVCRHYVEFLIGEESFKDNKPQYSFITSVIFSDHEKRMALQTFAGMHTLAEIAYRARKSSATMHVVEAAVLFESGSHKLMSEIIVAKCDEEEQMRRVLARPILGRDPLTREQAEERMKCQWSQEKKIALATYVIDTYCSLSELEVRVKGLYDQLIIGGKYV